MMLAKSAKTNSFFKSNFKKLLVFALFANIIASPNLLYEDYIKSAKNSRQCNRKWILHLENTEGGYGPLFLLYIGRFLN